MKLSIVSPEYMGEKMVDQLVSRIEASVSAISDDYEIILVNDCSPDNTWAKILEVCRRDKHVKGVNLSRNFGQQYAITAGLSVVSGDWIVVMDCDLQDRPEEIPRLWAKAQEGWDVVLAQRMLRKDTWLKKQTGYWFHKVMGYLTETTQDRTVANFGIYSRQVVDTVLSMGDAVRSFGAEVIWSGFRRAKLPVEHAARAEGKTSYNLHKLLKMAFENIIFFSNKPLRLMAEFGFIVSFVSFVIAIIWLCRYLLGDIEVSGFTSIIISMWLLGGIIIMLLGVVGVYLGKAYDQVKGRPTFIIRDKVNF